MTYKNIFYAFIMLLLLGACSSEEPSRFSDKELKEQDAAWAEMMVVHDRVMPEMNAIYHSGKALEKVAKENMVAADDTHPRAMEAIKALQEADDAMMDWMAAIGANKLSVLRAKEEMAHADIMSFLKEEQQKIAVVETQMLNSLKQAKALLTEQGSASEATQETSPEHEHEHGHDGHQH